MVPSGSVWERVNWVGKQKGKPWKYPRKFCVVLRTIYRPAYPTVRYHYIGSYAHSVNECEAGKFLSNFALVASAQKGER